MIVLVRRGDRSENDDERLARRRRWLDADRFWTFQYIETAIFVGLVALVVWRIR